MRCDRGAWRRLGQPRKPIPRPSGQALEPAPTAAHPAGAGGQIPQSVDAAAFDQRRAGGVGQPVRTRERPPRAAIELQELAARQALDRAAI
jgi:hypothetical protein